jgi:hypothetical protein
VLTKDKLLEKKNRFVKVIKWILLALVLVVIIAAVAFKIYTSHYYVADSEVIETIEQILDPQVFSYDVDGDGMVFVPKDQDIKGVIVFYPGGRVEYTAYNGLMYRIAAKGYLCLLPRMPENLAILSINAVDKLKSDDPEQQAYLEQLDWYLAGHSLGGVAAAKYLSEAFEAVGKAGDGAEIAGELPENLPEMPDGMTPKEHGLKKFKGLILCASYPTSSLADTDLRLLSIIGSNDTVVRIDGYEEGKNYWPEDATEYVIEGGIHSYFGNYGIQKGDGEPGITCDEQMDITADVIDKWIEGATFSS